MKGKLITVNIKNMDKINCNHKIFIVNSLKDKQYFIDKGWTINKDLAPNNALFYKFNNLKKQGKWNQEAFDTIYTDDFYDLMNSEPMNTELNNIKQLLDKNNDVAIMCYCPDVNMCHRSLIAEVFYELGYIVNHIK